MAVRMMHDMAARGLDLYQTPPEATWGLIKAEMLPTLLWEPHCGRGAIADILRAAGHDVFCSDIVDRGYTHQHVTGDFLKSPVPGFEPHVRGIVMNPPFKNAALHVQHAIALSPYVAALLPLRFLEAGNTTTAAGRARLDVVDGGRLARVHVFRSRLPMMHRDGWDGPIATSNVAYAWFVWERHHRGPATISRISWD